MEKKNTHYILEGKKVVPVDLMTWAMWFEKADRKVKRTELDNGVSVSTVFLGLGHSSIFEPDKLLIFETMIFGGEHDEYCERYSTWEEAEAGHQKAIELIFEV